MRSYNFAIFLFLFLTVCVGGCSNSLNLLLKKSNPSLEKIKPKAFFLENVRNLVSHDNGNTFAVIRKTIVEDLKYSFIPFLLNSKDYGNIPQTRDRIYIVGFKDESDFVFLVLVVLLLSFFLLIL